MLFTWDTTNLCIIFRWWHVSSTWTLLLSLAAVALLTAGYEGVREVSRRYENSSSEYMNSLPSMYSTLFDLVIRSISRSCAKCGIKDDDDNYPAARSPLWVGRIVGTAEQQTKMVKAALYAVQVFYSFFIM